MGRLDAVLGNHPALPCNQAFIAMFKRFNGRLAYTSAAHFAFVLVEGCRVCFYPVHPQLAGPAAFNSNQNRLPLPGSDSTPTRPPMRSTALRTMASPMPVPSYSL